MGEEANSCGLSELRATDAEILDRNERPAPCGRHRQAESGPDLRPGSIRPEAR